MSVFNFQQIMDDFYGSSPDTEAGKANKSAFQANLVQSMVDSQLAQQMAYVNQGIATGAMRTAADLEQPSCRRSLTTA